MILSHWLSSTPQRSTILRSLGIGSNLFMLSSLFLPWLLLPFQSSFPCGLPPSLIPSNCPAEGEVASQVSLWQVFTQQVPHAINQPITSIGMIPVGMAAITLALSFRAVQHHLSLARLGYVCALVAGLVAQGLTTFVVGMLSPLVITTVTNRLLLLALPYLMYLLMCIAGLALFSAPDHHEITENQAPAQNR